MIDGNTISLIANIARSSAADVMYKQAQNSFIPSEPDAYSAPSPADRGPEQKGKNWGNYGEEQNAIMKRRSRERWNEKYDGVYAGPQNVDPGDDNYNIQGMLDSARHDPTNTGKDVGYGPGYDPYQYGVPSMRSHELGRDRSGLPPNRGFMPTDRPRTGPPHNPFGGFGPFGPSSGPSPAKTTPFGKDFPNKLPPTPRHPRRPQGGLPFPAYGGGLGMPPLGGGLGGGKNWGNMPSDPERDMR